MPVALERKLKREVAGKKMSKDRKDAYVYGTLRKTGWKPSREKKKELSARLDSIIQFAELPNVGSSLERLRGIAKGSENPFIRNAVAQKQWAGLRTKPWDRPSIFRQRTIAGEMTKTPFQSSGYAPKLFNNREKPIEFGSEIMNPWQGSSGHTSKIDQLEFPAGLSPAAALKFPLPVLMRYLNQRNMLQQQFSWKQKRLIELSAKLDEIHASTHPTQ